MDQTIKIRTSVLSDISFCVELSHKKRLFYEKAQTQFWKYAGSHAELSQAKWFEELLTCDDHIMLTAVEHEKIVGFIIGKVVAAPEVYNPGGLTLMIDDFCVDNEANWHMVGSRLIQEIKTLSKTKGVAQILVVCGAHDEAKRCFLARMDLSVASEWYVGSCE